MDNQLTSPVTYDELTVTLSFIPPSVSTEDTGEEGAIATTTVGGQTKIVVAQADGSFEEVCCCITYREELF